MNRVNEQITEPHVLVIDENGENIGKFSTPEAIKLAKSKELTLVEVGKGVCKILNFEKFLYQQKKANKGKGHSPDLKEFRFGINIMDHDLQTKLNHINELLEKGHPIRVVVKFFGRENAHPEQGYEILEKIKIGLKSAKMRDPKKEGNQILAMIERVK